MKPTLGRESYSGEEVATVSQQWHLGSKLPPDQFHAPLLSRSAPTTALIGPHPISVIQLTARCHPGAPPSPNGRFQCLPPVQKCAEIDWNMVVIVFSKVYSSLALPTKPNSRRHEIKAAKEGDHIDGKSKIDSSMS